MSQPLYTVEIWPHGITLSRAAGQPGVPLEALTDTLPKLVGKSGVMFPGIARHLSETNHPSVVMAAGEKKNLKKWEHEIAESLKSASPEAQWWKGTNVGKSSASIFSACAESPELADRATRYSQGAYPHDADDFGRCFKLLKKFPEWNSKLNQVSKKFEENPGKWPELVAKWEQLTTLYEAEKFKEVTELIQNT